jgi:hypothetical protein
MFSFYYTLSLSLSLVGRNERIFFWNLRAKARLFFEGSRRARGENAADVRDNMRSDNDNRKGRGGPPPVSDSARTRGVPCVALKCGRLAA